MSKEQKISEGQKMPTWAIVVIVGLSVILLSLIIWIITHKVDSIDLGTTITPENWFSFLVTLIGVIITLFVGFQIFNMVEIRREIKDAEVKYEELKSNTELFITNSRDFLSKLEKEMGAFKLELLSKYNDTERELMEKQGDNTQRIDGYLKENEKEYQANLDELNESIAESKKTQEDIKKEMGDILNKWGIVSEKLDKSRNAICRAFLLLQNQTNDDNLKLYLLSSCIDIYPEIEKSGFVLRFVLDHMLEVLSKDDLSSGLVSVDTKCLRDIRLDDLEDKENIQRKINKILYLIDEKTPSAEDKEKQKDS